VTGNPLSRRRFIGAVGGVAGLAMVGFAGFGRMSESAGQTLVSRVRLPEPFTVPLHVPDELRAVPDPGSEDRYELGQRLGDVEIIPGTRTEVWGYDGTFPGPTIRARRDRPVTVTVSNELPTPTSTHLHGGVTPPDSDGYPTDLVLPPGYQHEPTGHSHMVAPEHWLLHRHRKDYVYPMRQQSATLWYHDHRMDFSAPQVWRGLAGFFLVSDDEEEALPLPKGDRDIPLMICDRAFHEDGAFMYPALDPSLQDTPGVEHDYMEGVQGDVTLVNGTPWPSLDVSGARYRFRLLNASNARRYRLALDPPPSGGDSFTQVGSDNGLLRAPVGHAAIPMSPAERFDVVVDFSQYPVGTQVRLVNTLESGRMQNVMQFHVVRRAREDSEVPARLADVPVLDPARAERVRRFDFRNTVGDDGHHWTINGRAFTTSHVEANPALGSIERWRFTSDFHHPVHLHLAHFQVLSRNGRDPLPTDVGWKDTVDVRPYETVDVLARFDGFRGRYMLHCHNLEHEDMAMMANFDVV